MKTAVHQYEDKLLEFAYGELPRHEADAVDAHVRTCQKCAAALDEIHVVRNAMNTLPMEPAPEAGLESLLAYAEQTARRNAEAAKKPPVWKRYVMMLASVSALAVVGVVAMRASETFQPDPTAMAFELQREDEAAAKKAEAKATAPTPAPAGAQAAPVVAADRPDDGTAQEAEKARANERYKAQHEEAGVEGGEALRLGDAKPGDEQQLAAYDKKAKAKPSRASQTKVASGTLDSMLEEKSLNKESAGKKQDWSNVATRGDSSQQAERDQWAQGQAVGQKGGNVAAPGFGLSAGSTAGSSTGGLGANSGLGTRGGGGTMPASPAPTKPAPPPPPAAKLPAPAAGRAELAKDLPAADDDQYATEARAPAAEPAAQQQAAAPAKKSIRMAPMSRSSSITSSSPRESEDVAAAMEEPADRYTTNKDAEFRNRQRNEKVESLLKSARAASGKSDRMGEIKLCLAALEAGAEGYSRVEALKRVCDGFEALGELDRADPYCDALVREFGNTAAARAVMDRRKLMQRAAPAKREMKSIRLDSADEAKSAEQPQPAEAAPAY